MYWECTFQKGVIIGYEREVKAFLLKALIEYLRRETFAESNTIFCYLKDVSDTFSVLAFVTNQMRLLES